MCWATVALTHTHTHIHTHTLSLSFGSFHNCLLTDLPCFPSPTMQIVSSSKDNNLHTLPPFVAQHILILRSTAQVSFPIPFSELLHRRLVCHLSGCPREAVSFSKFAASSHLFPFQIPFCALGCPWQPCTCPADLSQGTAKDALPIVSSLNRKNLTQPHHNCKPIQSNPTQFNAYTLPSTPHLSWTPQHPNSSQTLHKLSTSACLYLTLLSYPQASHLHQTVFCLLPFATFYLCATRLTHLYLLQFLMCLGLTQSLHQYYCPYNYQMPPSTCHSSLFT